MLFLGRADAVDLGDVDVARDGSFSTTVTVPRDASPGEAAIVASGSPYDDCPDDASCAGYSVDVLLVPGP